MTADEPDDESLGPEGLGRLWAGWRLPYLDTSAARQGGGKGPCTFCRILAGDMVPDETFVVWSDERCAVVLNAFPYTSGHLMVMPVRHVADLEDCTPEEATGLWTVMGDAVVAVRAAYSPEGLNIGANLGKAAGAGIPGHLHLHCVPRWSGDTNFMTTLANTRVLPETLASSYARLRAAWPRPRP